MRRLRPATISDLPAIYQLQNTPYRQEMLDTDLLPFEPFLQEKTVKMNTGEELYYILEEDGVSRATIWFSPSADFCHTIIWGPWLKTLIYCSGKAAFDHLKVPRLVFGVRQSNRRMVRACELFTFRIVGETKVTVTLEEPPYLGTALINFYDITMAEFREREALMRSQSLPLEFIFP